MASERNDCNCRSIECLQLSNNQNSNVNNDVGKNSVYRIVSLKENGLEQTACCPVGDFLLLDLSGDVPDIAYNESSKNIDSPKQQGASKVVNSIATNRLCHNYFINKDIPTLSRTVSTSSDINQYRIWGQLKGDLGFLSKELNQQKRFTLTIGKQILNGKQNVDESGTHLLILRNVPDHCSCLCSKSNVEKQHECHSGYYEICGVVDYTLVFNERPSFFFHSLDNDSTKECWNLYTSLNINDAHTKWIIVKVNDYVLDEILKERGFFKVVNNETKKRLVLCIPGYTYNIERTEAGGIILLVYNVKSKFSNVVNQNLMSIVGSTKYVHNLIKIFPNYTQLPKNTLIDPKRIYEFIPASDEEIKEFLLNQNNVWPCHYIFMDKGFKFVEQHVYGEFVVRLLCTIPIYFSQHLKNRPSIYNLTIGDILKLIQCYPKNFEIIDSKTPNDSVIVQLLMAIGDFEEDFMNFESLLNIDISEEILNTRLKLNLYKIHWTIARCIAHLNHEIKYDDIAIKVDVTLFNDAIPSYIFDDLILYLINKNTIENSKERDYRDCIEFYYRDGTFDEVSNNLMKQFNTGKRTANEHDNLFSKTGVSLFDLGNSKNSIRDLSKTNCCNYPIYKLNTKGLTLLRHNYSMNSLLSVCRCPLSLHLGFLADEYIAIIKQNECVLKEFPLANEESLRDILSALFKLQKQWNLEILEQKLKPFIGDKDTLATITGGPEFHARLWINEEINYKNYTLNNGQEIIESSLEKKSGEGILERIKEESYIIINSNVPIR
ncbi:hypothetical protein BdWA1_001949 [Babesia duncani]|uniref:Uncharacterized protein n=1 Tax=Babesia duncani TaxID=323732 RepID=A0AAD9PKU7_9APIC|nr:hypothetical protein BdWA1_001949 [Babesia duncani]